jgi:hypothetical protein
VFNFAPLFNRDALGSILAASAGDSGHRNSAPCSNRFPRSTSRKIWGGHGGLGAEYYAVRWSDEAASIQFMSNGHPQYVSSLFFVDRWILARVASSIEAESD